MYGSLGYEGFPMFVSICTRRFRNQASTSTVSERFAIVVLYGCLTIKDKVDPLPSDLSVSVW